MVAANEVGEDLLRIRQSEHTFARAAYEAAAYLREARARAGASDDVEQAARRNTIQTDFCPSRSSGRAVSDSRRRAECLPSETLAAGSEPPRFHVAPEHHVGSPRAR